MRIDASKSHRHRTLHYTAAGSKSTSALWREHQRRARGGRRCISHAAGSALYNLHLALCSTPAPCFSDCRRSTNAQRWGVEGSAARVTTPSSACVAAMRSHSNGPSHLPLASSLPRVSFRRIPPHEAQQLAQPAGVHQQQIIDFGFNDGREYTRPDTYIRHVEPVESELKKQVEYDMDEQDQAWLDALNAERARNGDDRVSYETFEIIIDRFEKEWFDLMRQVPAKPCPTDVNGADDGEDTKCAICDDGECENSNAIVFCDGCNLAVHQDCYGIPYIPEGQWLCRKCTVSPDRAVSCIFCPHEGGAFKQTSQGKWAHLLCAMWIPETGVSNPVYMEPIDSVERVPKARWKLQCYLCKRKMGACIQCENRSCFTAFHVTCARQAGLLIKATRRRVEGGGGGAVHGDDSGSSATAADDSFGEEYVEALHACCHRHISRDAQVLGGGAPAHGVLAQTAGAGASGRGSVAGSDRDLSRGSTPLINPDSSAAQGVRHADGGHRKSITVKRNKTGKLTFSVSKKKKISKSARAYKKSYRVGLPLVPVYIINRVSDYVRNILLRKKSALLLQLAKFWSLKREARRGAPLLKRLHLEPWTASGSKPYGTGAGTGAAASDEEREKKFIFLSRLRQDLENLRALTELIRKREREKQRQVKLFRATLVGAVLKPYHAELRMALEKIAVLDHRNHFLNPVNKTVITDYYDIVKEPMDWQTICAKCDNFEYTTIDQFERDVRLVADNSILYNKADTSYHKAALKVRAGAQPILTELRAKLGVHHLRDYGIDHEAVAISGETKEELLAHLPALELEPEQPIIELLNNYGDQEMLETIADGARPEIAPRNIVEDLLRLYHRAEHSPTAPAKPKLTRAELKAQRSAQRSETAKRAAALRKERAAAKLEARNAADLPSPAEEQTEAALPPERASRRRRSADAILVAAESSVIPAKRPRRTAATAAPAAPVGALVSAEPEQLSKRQKPASASDESDSRVKRREESQTVAPTTLEVDNVGEWDSFKRFNVGWVLPEGTKRGGRIAAPPPQMAPKPRANKARTKNADREQRAESTKSEFAALDAEETKARARSALAHQPEDEDVGMLESSELSDLEDEELAEGEEGEESDDEPPAGRCRSERARAHLTVSHVSAGDGMHQARTQKRGKHGQFIRKHESTDKERSSKTLSPEMRRWPVTSRSRSPSPSRSKAAADAKKGKARDARVESSGSTSPLSSPLSDDAGLQYGVAAEEDIGDDQCSETEEDITLIADNSKQPQVVGQTSAERRRTIREQGKARTERLGAMRKAQEKKELQRTGKTHDPAVVLRAVQHKMGHGQGRGHAQDDALGSPRDPDELPPGRLVWARFEKWPYFPSEVFAEDSDQVPERVLEHKPSGTVTLVRFFDAKQSWAWVTLDRIRFAFEDLAQDEKLKHPADKRSRKSVREAYRRAEQARAADA
ncbi:hypothetical protein K437DRAFT_243037 [Tilletiaria anomala UBC 951]|uniref:Uncharacterized protein n=1 Tax=Tilletiaria anomala (strain ATCC 24038 / CBS 436.72 / UBC 951) TaxID=1037660 RepID=A0A066WK01_TILAU|nr:uncharacterized protein K437DRAFT_243037 [Tilletiaria anomala UBC 951]KDN52878.1 hypothetical protein K437DRAFT_243037 [Tilletiaria anomala UBC 951]